MHSSVNPEKTLHADIPNPQSVPAVAMETNDVKESSSDDFPCGEQLLGDNDNSLVLILEDEPEIIDLTQQ